MKQVSCQPFAANRARTDDYRISRGRDSPGRLCNFYSHGVTIAEVCSSGRPWYVSCKFSGSHSPSPMPA